ncbi:MAG: phenylalanine--tRNA ligase subunit beta [Bacteroidetes bacterium GWF2_33_38]|nr:MAG: phenylalanine--tRNA ligase subunit beta [Bacteroidetes bacterium GWF2_33_38]OFY76484.1 MAG: phenylalanine--tRNA ligase subunit beta [Bacteroidetes bacterium RIFOXYA12_FULL_33_9]OFY89736.1 MAG: phenylalanine--tRNA ligase subunit beta [Bacteroidetes bacterium RIFOXYA2_FULL_33_7]HBX52620.1 phenylalanine--tRNA ligase subunit beta [Bacteroidales bacterium]
MKISYNWLKQYIQVDKTVDELSQILTDIGLEVESVEPFQEIKGGLEGIVIGKVIECAKHPDADKLSITKVDVCGPALLDIVCGAPNVALGQKVVVATVGTTLYNGDESFVIKKSKIRGAVSDGMICAEDEIGLGTSHDGIMILSDLAPIGTPASRYFKIEEDFVFEIGLTPNRIDAASHIGVARDLAAYFSQFNDIQVNIPDVSEFKIDNKQNVIPIIVENAEACPRYAGITISGVEVKESPKWLQNRLKAIGLRPINNIVDITNYILHETGQPLHAFDAAKIKGKKVIVKTLSENTLFKTLDEVDRKLSNNDLMICNAEEGMCMAGVFGGFDSGVNQNTKDIFLECAYFNPVFVRKTAKRHILSTDSSFRFERGTDPNNIEYVIKRAAMLIKEIAGGLISSDIQDFYPSNLENKIFEVSYKNITRLIGKEIEKGRIKKILQALDIKIVQESDEVLILEIPTYRVDVTREADVIEDILRIYGYNNIEIGEKLNSSITYSIKPDKDKYINVVSNFLSSNGFHEIMSNSLTKSEYYENLFPNDTSFLVKILNPLSQDLNAIRASLLFNGLESISYNLNRKTNDIKMYEFGYCYTMSNDETKKYHEEYHLAMYISGLKNEANWNTSEKQSDFYYLKSYVENLFLRLGVNPENLVTEVSSCEVFSESLIYKVGHKVLASIGIVKKQRLKEFDIKQDVFYADIVWDVLMKESVKNNVLHNEISKFPEVRRDLALLLDKKVTFEEIRNIAYDLERKLLKRVSLFDVFEGEKIGADKKSYAVSFILQDENKTLTDKQIDKIMSRFIDAYKEKLNGILR